MGFIQDCITCFMLGYTGEYNRILNELEQENTQKQIEPVKADEPPYYIDLELSAITEQIKVNEQIIEEYRFHEMAALNGENKLKWKKKRIDLEYKNTQLDKKYYKLLEKYKPHKIY